MLKANTAIMTPMKKKKERLNRIKVLKAKTAIMTQMKKKKENEEEEERRNRRRKWEKKKALKNRI